MTDNNITEEIQRIRYYLIDYENVHQAGLNGIEKLTENDRLVIFYTTNAKPLLFHSMKNLFRVRQIYSFIRCSAVEKTPSIFSFLLF